MATTKKCDICKKNFTEADEYVNGNIDFTYVAYEYDAGSMDKQEHFDACKKCFKETYDLIIEMKKSKQKKAKSKK